MNCHTANKNNYHHQNKNVNIEGTPRETDGELKNNHTPINHIKTNTENHHANQTKNSKGNEKTNHSLIVLKKQRRWNNVKREALAYIRRLQDMLHCVRQHTAQLRFERTRARILRRPPVFM